METAAERFWRGLLEWYHRNKRDFPWRRTTNPFHILTAEILLQQTNVRKVQEVYERLIGRYPTPQQMAEADLSELESIIGPLGLRYRAVRLKKCAEVICREFGGQVPNTYEQLRLLPGVGPYIADAVLCYAFGLATVPIDTNVVRLFCRYFGLRSEKSRPRNDPALAESIRRLFIFDGFDGTRTANLAVLDFAGTVCTAGRPGCGQCPISSGCAFLRGAAPADGVSPGGGGPEENSRGREGR
ncbi:A/G-specific adenine glycosylase [Desulfovirgula thermocuniculi]|uniref:A/G-specific adenine glycosylase n=1 Tax=Desulfovirgula thermocuniculi TaxID=348842 RepID=UPI000415312F|nr:A/G-specific adenine glycosylase [Desulfovirgula thermocuniculi]